MSATASKIQSSVQKQTAPRGHASAEQVARRQWFTNDDVRNDVIGHHYRVYRPKVEAYLLRVGVLQSDVEDACNEVFVVVLKKLSTYQGASSLSTWVFGIARKIAADYRSSARHRHEVLVAELPERSTSRHACHVLEDAERTTAVRRAVAGLKKNQRAVVTRHVFEETPINSVARQQGEHLQTVYSRLYAAHVSLRVALEADWSC
jgi:RNA polymerase sigma-70 factor (ECF subfamily)